MMGIRLLTSLNRKINGPKPMTIVSIVFLNGEFFDVQVGLSNKQRPAIRELIERKNAKAKELGLNHNWTFDEFTVPNIVDFIENIRLGFIPNNDTDPELVAEMAKGSI